jgi:hypothetical protein
MTLATWLGKTGKKKQDRACLLLDNFVFSDFLPPFVCLPRAGPNKDSKPIAAGRDVVEV